MVTFSAAEAPKNPARAGPSQSFLQQPKGKRLAGAQYGDAVFFNQFGVLWGLGYRYVRDENICEQCINRHALGRVAAT